MIKEFRDFAVRGNVVDMAVGIINRSRRQQAQPAAAPTSKTCRYCRTSIAVAAIRCPNCTSQL
jgi:large conductance mechanosensitive channel